jgi:preprotein translocase subunit SecG
LLFGEHRGVQSMLDVFMVVIGIVFFALSVGYALACERL